MRVLKTGVCPSLSGKSKLTYEIGSDPAGQILVRISKNSGSGWFSKDWIGLPRVHELLTRNGTKPITFHTLLPLFKGLSVNTAGFLLAVLKHEGLVQPMADNRRCYERLEAKAFFAEIQALMKAPAVASKAKAKH